MDFAQFQFNADEFDDNQIIASPVKRVKYEKQTKYVSTPNKMIAAGRSEPPTPVGLSELYRSISYIEAPLKLLIVGHNPSDQSYTKGHFYANPSNRMWYLLTKAGIVPKHFTCIDDIHCPHRCGLGFTDLICGVSETKSNRFSDKEVRDHKTSLFTRISQHIHSAAQECGIPIEEAYPKVVAFSGVRQWKMLFPANSTVFQSGTQSSSSQSQQMFSNFFTVKESGDSMSIKGESAVGSSAEQLQQAATAHRGSSSSSSSTSRGQFGVQTARPPGWPACLSKSIVFVLPSSSGAAAMTNEEREGPYLELGVLLRQFPWPVHYPHAAVKEEGAEESCESGANAESKQQCGQKLETQGAVHSGVDERGGVPTAQTAAVVDLCCNSGTNIDGDGTDSGSNGRICGSGSGGSIDVVDLSAD